ncbi:MAG: hypothetical protein N2663_03950 [Chlorobi bacterium]|nr:hypothetical protein [Chlorobiota bacterium]
MVLLAVAMRAQSSVGVWAGTVPSAARLFNDGLWRGTSTGIEISSKLPVLSSLVDLPVAIAAAAEYIRPTHSTVVLLDDYRGWILRGSLQWFAGSGTAPYLRLGAGITIGERVAHAIEWDSTSALTWTTTRSLVVYWGFGLRGSVAAAVGWFAELECMAGDQVGVLLPIRIGLSYRWGEQ